MKIETKTIDANDLIFLKFLIRLAEKDIIKQNEIMKVVKYYFDDIQLKIMLEIIKAGG